MSDETPRNSCRTGHGQVWYENGWEGCPACALRYADKDAEALTDWGNNMQTALLKIAEANPPGLTSLAEWPMFAALRRIARQALGIDKDCGHARRTGDGVCLVLGADGFNHWKVCPPDSDGGAE